MKSGPPTFRDVIGQTSLLTSIEQMVLEAGISLSPFLKALRSDLNQTPDPRRALNNVHRFLSSGFSISLLRDFHQHRLLQQIALELFSQSQYLADILVRDPELFRWLTSTPALKTVETKSAYLPHARRVVAPFGRVDKKLDALKRFQRRELLRIGAREILQEADVSVTAGELSALAECILSALVELAEQHLSERSGKSPPGNFAVIGLGKLGGGELNFSSDIDLMFVYDSDGEFDVPQLRVKTLHEYYSRVAEFIVRRLTEHTAAGRLYRVDLRLRPEGTAGPIAMSRPAYMNYYETRGELWEKQMLTKARVVAGNVEVGEKLLNDLRPFVYPKTHSRSPLDEIAEMKRKIEGRTDPIANIKLGTGGIRDIEFIVQALQLLHGGRAERLRERNTLKAVERLAEESLLKRAEQAQLAAAYKFFRIVEHRLQLLYGMQTHSLPDSKEETELLAKRLGFRSPAAFRKQLTRHRRTVRRIFTTVFGFRKTKLTAISTEGMSDRFLRTSGFQNTRNAVDHLKKIVESFPELHAQQKFNLFLRKIKKQKAPDWALHNLSLFLNAPSLRRSVLQALDSEKLPELFLLVCSRSRLMSELLAAEPLLFETLVGQPGEFLSGHFGWEFLRDGDVRRYKAFNEFKILLRWLLSEISVADATRELSGLADEIVTRRYLREVHGQVPTALVALGKYGGSEITVGSDLDLLLIYRGQDASSARVAETIARKFVSSFVEEGLHVYDLDMRLRPEGKSAPLAVEFSYYREYLMKRASLWERQALVKARVIAGDQEVAKDVHALVGEFAFHPSLQNDEVNDLARMRRKIELERSKKGIDLKVGRGGLVDLEYLVQVLQMNYGAEKKASRVSNSFDAIDALGEEKIFKKSEAKTLRENLFYLRSLETLVRLNSGQSDFVLPRDRDQLVALAAAMGEQSTDTLIQRVRTIQKTNRKLMLKAFQLCREP